MRINKANTVTHKTRVHQIKPGLISISFLLPAMLLLCFFLIIPFLFAFGLSFTDQRLLSNPNLPTEFIGFRNYLRLFQDPNFTRALLNNFYFVIVVVPVQTTLSLCLALLINQKLRFINVFRTIYFSPVVTIMTVTAIVWTFLYNPDKGLINQILSTISFGLIKPLNWLNDTRTAFPAVMILSIWQGAGFQMVIFLAGLQDIPEELYAAATIDGASAGKRFWHITFPLLRNKTIFIIISTTILAFKLFDQVMVISNGTGGPQNATLTSILLLYREGYKQQHIGYASAIAVLFFLVVLLISLVQRFVLKDDA